MAGGGVVSRGVSVLPSPSADTPVMEPRTTGHDITQMGYRVGCASDPGSLAVRYVWRPRARTLGADDQHHADGFKDEEPNPRTYWPIEDEPKPGSAKPTAAHHTVLLVLGVPERTVMSVMGWSSTAMAARYQHVTDPIRRDVARRVDGLLWGADDDE